MRRLRSERGVLLLLVLLVGATSLIVAAAPRLYNSVADAGLRSVLSETSATRRNIALTRDVFAAPGELTPDAVRAQVSARANQFDPAIQSVIRNQEYLVASPRFHVDPSPQFRTFVTLRSQSGVDDAIDLVSGRWPAHVTAPPTPDSPPQIEIAISRTTAEESGLAVGQVLTAGPEQGDQLVLTYGGFEAEVHFPIVGEFDIKDPSADIWYADNRLEHVGLAFTANDAQA